MDAGKKTINDIFNGNRLLEIPFFQRAYVWGEKQWERLLDDMEKISREARPYFFGSVILKQQPTSTTGTVGDIRTLIDGQQRLTTITIFLKVYCLRIGRADLFNRIFRLLSNDLIAIRHNHSNIDSFEKIINLTPVVLPENYDDPILSCFHFFNKNIDIEKLDLQNIIQRILFVVIDLDVNEDEQQIFDTINSIGVTLTTAELLKNYFFNRDDIGTYEKYWKSIFEHDEASKDYWDTEVVTGRQRRTFIDLFFYSYLQIATQDPELKVSSADKESFSRVEELFESYKKFIKEYKGDDKVAVLPAIKSYAETFRKNFKADIVNRELTAAPGIDRINAIIFGLETSTIISYVLFVLQNEPEESKRNELFETVESYLMRRMVVHATAKDYNHLFTDRLISNKILSSESFIDLILKSSDKINYFPANLELERGFQQAILNNKQSAGILYFIESKIRNQRLHSTQLLGLGKYTLEHLLPKKWENQWPKPADRAARNARDRKLLTLGNLAIITQSLNSSIRDNVWKIKKEGKGTKYGLAHFSAGLETLGKYLRLDIWDENSISSRANDLFMYAKQIWPGDFAVESDKRRGSEPDSSRGSNRVELNKIGPDLFPEIYAACLGVYEKRLTLAEASERLHSENYMNLNSARDYINNFKLIMAGQTFNRTLNAPSMKYILERIKENFTEPQFLTALTALKGHIEYYESCHPGELTAMRTVFKDLKKDLTSDESKLFLGDPKKSGANNSRFLKLDLPKKAILAFAEILDNKKVLVLKGSKISADVTESFRKSSVAAFKLREKYLKEGVIDSDNVFTKDILFDTKSGAASLIMGYSANGNVMWIARDIEAILE